MAVYAGSITTIWSVSIGNKVMSLLQVRVTNYNQSGIPLTGKATGVGHVEAVFSGSMHKLSDGNSPIGLEYDPLNQVCHCYKGASQEVPSDINLYSTIGDMLFLVIGS